MSDMTELFRSWCQKNWRWRLAAVMSPLLFIRWGPGKIVGEIAATQLVCVVLSRKKDPAKKRYAMVVVVAWLCHWESALVVLCAKPKKTAAAAACCPVVVYCFDAFYTTAAWLLVTLLGRFPPWRSTTSTAKDHVSRAHDCCAVKTNFRENPLLSSSFWLQDKKNLLEWTGHRIQLLLL